MKFLSTSLIKKEPTYDKKHSINLNKNEFINLLNLTLGLYYPLNKFCSYTEYKNIILHSKLDKKINWTIPIMLTLKKIKKFIKRIVLTP
jgi:ATP sulfurylase